MREKKSLQGKGSLPPLNAIRSFEAAARRGSFARAASDLNVTHWAIGKQIRLLEDWLGVPLFERRPRQIVLTDEGAEFLADVTAAFSRLSGATAKLVRHRTTRRVSGLVRIAQAQICRERVRSWHSIKPGYRLSVEVQAVDEGLAAARVQPRDPAQPARRDRERFAPAHTAALIHDTLGLV
jgi:DNA-binding transcriptional LysR family regulator